MSNRRSYLNLAVALALIGPIMFPDSAIARATKWFAMGWLMLDLVLSAREGYLRRRPHWTRASWRGYFTLCLIPVGALIIMIGMMTALELRMPIVGAPRTSLRLVWGLGTVFFMVVFVFGLFMAIDRLRQGDPARPFEWPRWLGRRRRAS